MASRVSYGVQGTMTAAQTARWASTRSKLRVPKTATRGASSELQREAFAMHLTRQLAPRSTSFAMAAALVGRQSADRQASPPSPTTSLTGKELVLYRRSSDPPPASQVCRVLEVRKSALGALGVTAIVRHDARQSAAPSETTNSPIEYPVTKYVVEHMSWPNFKRSGGSETLDADLFALLDAQSRSEWLGSLMFFFGKSRKKTLYHINQPRVPQEINRRNPSRLAARRKQLEHGGEGSGSSLHNGS
ncbi:uncharacterized protein K452DRAFT_357523 [Aplosporella prunicola CBS 121167]|uniref:Uncharacterized protein n=1 Tax=Aplosporella prunicola CBS 121167 TaxID=1176127 RepID=A0A6A6BKM9_9PEZI|nr:uncharacterized protein K452DRAFT_357523 [Aplosporella prunicola CBS 121167]KAF2143943.1 hypothetical protein K452DRAFT_357523 [Aplosporella prunicola CBS 121167]